MGSKDTKFSLNQDELALLSDPSFFFKKQQVTTRIIEMFGSLESEFDRIGQKYRDNLPLNILNKRGKISRGENYRGLPYIILDYPAIFEKTGVFAFRSLMWWGHPITFTFHLSGSYLDQYQDRIVPSLGELDRETKICINTGQWEHHQEATNYIPVADFLESTFNTPDYFSTKGFLKLSKAVPLDQHPLVFQSGTDFLEEILTLLK